MSKTKITIVTNIVTPYRIPLFNRINKMKGIKLNVVALSENEENREWQVVRKDINFKYEILHGWHTFLRSKDLAIHLNWGLWKYLRKSNPDVIITSGYSSIAYWEAFLYCKFYKKKYILWNGTTLLSVRKINGIICNIKRIIIMGADRYIAYGTKAADYLVYMGALKKYIHIGLNTVDMKWYRGKTVEIRRGKSFKIERLKYPEILILYVGQLIPRKGIKQIIVALHELGDSDVGLMILGNGPQKEELKKLCQSLNLNNVYFSGFQQKEQIPFFYALADLFVLPSFKEPWGLVINEALASGLYVLSSDRAGASHNLIKEDWNGLLFDPYDVRKLAFSIKKTKDQIKKIRIRRGKISEHACKEFDIGRYVKTFLETIDSLYEGS